jgi:hypothetical protein
LNNLFLGGKGAKAQKLKEIARLLGMCLVWRRIELLLTELSLIELSLIKSELSRIDLCLDTFSKRDS